MLTAAPAYLLSFAGAFALYGIAGLLVTRAPNRYSSRIGLLLILGNALAIRLALLPAPPTLSGDIYRYLWDGKVSREGRNPYALPPDAPELTPLRGPYWRAINYRDVRTPYPPVAQRFFSLTARIRPDNPLPFKLLLLGAELAIICALLALLRQQRLPPAFVLFYAWNPLVLAEGALSGHLDFLAIAFFLLALPALRRPGLGGSVLGAVFLGLSLATKPYALVALPLLARWRGPGIALGALGVAAATFLPYLDAGTHLMSGTRAMMAGWRNNGSLYEIAIRLLADHVLHPNVTARQLLAALLLLISLLLAWRPLANPADLWRRLYYAFLCALFTSAVVYPWYVVWLAPFLVLAPTPSGFAFTALISLKYLPLALPPPVTTRLWIEYLPVYLLLAWEAGRSKR